jgi:transcriptional regulator with XRE-family HTH domain
MSTTETINVNLAERLIAIVDELAGGNAKKFAERAGIKQATLHNYLNGRPPKTEALHNICKTYNINLNWLVAGVGPRFIEKGGSVSLDPDPEIAQLMEGARRVLTSGNPIAFDALERNIRYFDHAIAAEKRADASDKRAEAAERQISEMKSAVAELRQEMEKLKRQHCQDGENCDEDQSSGEQAA